MAHSPRGAIDEETLEVRAGEVTSSDLGDVPMLPELLSQIPREQEIGSVTADGACDTRKCHDAIAGRGAIALNEGPMPSYRPAKKRQTMEDRHGRCRRAQRGSASVEISGPCALATPLGSILWMRLPGNGWSGYYRRSRVEI